MLLVLAVNAAVPVKTVPELIDYAKKNADKKLSYGSAGIGSAHHIAGELLKQKTGIDMLHVPYRGGGPAIQDLVAGHIPISFGTTPAVLPQANAGTVRILALVEAKRSPDLPGVPTVAETVPDVVTMTWLGLFAPAGTPQADHRAAEQDRRRRAQAPGHHREAQAAGRQRGRRHAGGARRTGQGRACSLGPRHPVDRDHAGMTTEPDRRVSSRS